MCKASSYYFSCHFHHSFLKASLMILWWHVATLSLRPAYAQLDEYWYSVLYDSRACPKT